MFQRDTNDTNDIDDTSAIPIEFNQHVFDSQCKMALCNLDKRINQALLKATAKTGKTLLLMSKAQEPKIVFQQCESIFSVQRELLLNVKLLGNKNNLTSCSTQQLKPLSPETLNTLSVQRLIKVKRLNRHLCINSYRQLLRNGPLLEHLKSLPESTQILLNTSPERCDQKLISMLTFQAYEQQLPHEAVALNHLVLSSFFFSYLAEVYTALTQSLVAFFKKFEPLLASLKTSHYNAILDITPPCIGNRSKADPILDQEHIQINNRQKTLGYEPTITTNTAVFNSKKTAIDRQISEQLDQEQVARIQLKKTPKGTVFQWAGSHYDRPTQYIKLITHEIKTQTIIFHDEQTAEFIHYDIEALIQAMLAGDLIKQKKKPKIKPKPKPKIIYWAQSLSKMLKFNKY